MHKILLSIFSCQLHEIEPIVVIKFVEEWPCLRYKMFDNDKMKTMKMYNWVVCLNWKNPAYLISSTYIPIVNRNTYKKSPIQSDPISEELIRLRLDKTFTIFYNTIKLLYVILRVLLPSKYI